MTIKDGAWGLRLHPTSNCRLRWLTRSNLRPAKYMGAHLPHSLSGYLLLILPPSPRCCSANFLPRRGHWCCLKRPQLTSASSTGCLALRASSGFTTNPAGGSNHAMKGAVANCKHACHGGVQYPARPILLVAAEAHPGWKGRPYSVSLRIRIAVGASGIYDCHPRPSSCTLQHAQEPQENKMVLV